MSNEGSQIYNEYCQHKYQAHVASAIIAERDLLIDNLHHVAAVSNAMQKDTDAKHAERYVMMQDAHKEQMKKLKIPYAEPPSTEAYGKKEYDDLLRIANQTGIDSKEKYMRIYTEFETYKTEKNLEINKLNETIEDLQDDQDDGDDEGEESGINNTDHSLIRNQEGQGSC